MVRNNVARFYGSPCRRGLTDCVLTMCQNKSPLPGDAMEHVGCIFCDASLRPLVELKHARPSRPVNLHRRGATPSRGAGKGRGRGGRGRGRGRPKDKMSQLDAYFV